MARTVEISIQDFGDLIRGNEGNECLYEPRGIQEDHICSYGFAFEGKKVLIGWGAVV